METNILKNIYKYISTLVKNLSTELCKRYEWADFIRWLLKQYVITKPKNVSTEVINQTNVFEPKMPSKEVLDLLYELTGKKQISLKKDENTPLKIDLEIQEINFLDFVNFILENSNENFEIPSPTFIENNLSLTTRKVRELKKEMFQNNLLIKKGSTNFILNKDILKENIYPFKLKDEVI